MVDYYPPAAFGHNRVAASIDTPLHAFLPAPHVDHLHPDWAIALAASANGRQKLEEFNRRFGRRIIWVPWQRPGFELALLIESAVEDNPGADGSDPRQPRPVHVGRHPARVLPQQHPHDRPDGSVHRRTSRRHAGVRRRRAQTARRTARHRRSNSAGTARDGVVEPARHRALHRRGRGADVRRTRNGQGDSAVSARAAPITSCARASVRSFVEWDPSTGSVDTLKAAIRAQVGDYRNEYRRYYDSFAAPDSPKLRDVNPSVVIIPGVGLFGFGRNKKEARIATEFFLNAINVMAGATALEDAGSTGRTTAAGAPAGTGGPVRAVPQLRRAAEVGSLPHRILGAGRSEAAADACRERSSAAK